MRSLRGFLNDLSADEEGVKSKNRLTQDILSNIYKVSEINKGFVYITTVEHTIRMLNLTPIHACMGIYAISKIVEELRSA